MILAIDPCALQFCKPLIPQSKRSNDYLQLLIRSEVPAAEPFSNLHVNKQRQLHGSWPSQARCRAVGSGFSLSPMHMYKVLLSSAHQGTTDSLLTRWGAGPSLLAHGGIFKWSRMAMAPTRLGHSLELDTP